MDIGSGYISKNLKLYHIKSISKIAPINTHFWQVFREHFTFFRNSSRHIEQKQAFFYQLLISTSHLCNEMKCRCLFTIHCHWFYYCQVFLKTKVNWIIGIWIWIWIWYISDARFGYRIWIYIHFEIADLDMILHPKKVDMTQCCIGS